MRLWGARCLGVTAVLWAAVTFAGQPAADDLFMWHLQSETAAITLVGSVHVGKPDFFPLPVPYEQAFAGSSVLAVEVDMSDPAVMADAARLMLEKGRLEAGETLESRLSTEVYRRLQERATEIGFPLAMYNTFRPGIVVVALMMQEYTRQGFDPELGVDKHFLDAAKERQLPVRSLETVGDQLNLFLDIDDVLDDLLVAESLDEATDIAGSIAEMLAYWRHGDADGLNAYMQLQMGEGPQMAAFYRRILDDRNVVMAATIRSWLDGDEDVFVVVGAGHFGGPNGLVKLLGCERGLPVAH